jgi:putative ABC transport system substrate-binding protein
MKRRNFIALLGGAAATWSLAANAQQVRRIGVLLGFAESDRDAQSGLALLGGASKTRVDGGPQHRDGDSRGWR